MPATKTSAKGRPASAAKRAADNDRHLKHVMSSLEAAQKDLSSIGGGLGTGARDLRRDVTKMLREARRDVLKMQRSVQRDLARLQKDLSAAAGAKRRSGSKRPARV